MLILVRRKLHRKDAQSAALLSGRSDLGAKDGGPCDEHRRQSSKKSNDAGATVSASSISPGDGEPFDGFSRSRHLAAAVPSFKKSKSCASLTADDSNDESRRLSLTPSWLKGLQQSFFVRNSMTTAKLPHDDDVMIC